MGRYKQTSEWEPCSSAEFGRARSCGSHLLAALIAASNATAFQVLPKVIDVDRKNSTLGRNPVLDYLGHWFVGSAISIMKSPVHESISLAAIGCNASLGSVSDCVTIDAVKEQQVFL